jgi:hypothetical protein
MSDDTRKLAVIIVEDDNLVRAHYKIRMNIKHTWLESADLSIPETYDAAMATVTEKMRENCRVVVFLDTILGDCDYLSENQHLSGVDFHNRLKEIACSGGVEMPLVVSITGDGPHYWVSDVGVNKGKIASVEAQQIVENWLSKDNLRDADMHCVG